MNERVSTLHLVCGKIASGKSTFAHKLAQAKRTVLIREDAWLSALYGEELKTVADYVQFSARLRNAIGPHVVALLKNGMSVVLDFPANTREVRAWMHDLIRKSGAAHTLHFLDVPDEVCKARLRQRNAGGAHEFNVTDEQFERITQHFAAPAVEEGFLVVKVSGKA